VATAALQEHNRRVDIVLHTRTLTPTATPPTAATPAPTATSATAGH
jgi:hypothetical protein